MKTINVSFVPHVFEVQLTETVALQFSIFVDTGHTIPGDVYFDQDIIKDKDMFLLSLLPFWEPSGSKSALWSRDVTNETLLDWDSICGVLKQLFPQRCFPVVHISWCYKVKFMNYNDVDVRNLKIKDISDSKIHSFTVALDETTKTKGK